MSIRLSLLQNAIDSMERAIKSYNQKDFKSGLNYLWSSLLLFFKYKLYLIHPAFIYSDIMDCVDIEGDYFISEKTIKRITKSHQFSSIEISTLIDYKDKCYQTKDLLINAIKSNISMNEQKKKVLLNL
mgnify:CR=1 FL=1